jgi:hypothetical protein
MDKLMHFLENLSVWHWVLVILIGALIAFNKFIRGFLLFLKKERRLQSNLKRPILLIKPTDQEINIKYPNQKVPMNMEREKDLLARADLFKIEGPITADEISTRIKDHGLIILGYCKGMDCFDEVLSAVKQKQIPIIIYTFGDNRLESGDLERTKEYAWHTLSNFPVRLASEAYSILTTFQYDKEQK